jgi:hypothetical protein
VANSKISIEHAASARFIVPADAVPVNEPAREPHCSGERETNSRKSRFLKCQDYFGVLHALLARKVHGIRAVPEGQGILGTSGPIFRFAKIQSGPGITKQNPHKIFLKFSLREQLARQKRRLGTAA